MSGSPDRIEADPSARDYLTVKEVASLFLVSERTIRDQIRLGKFTLSDGRRVVQKVGQAHRFDRALFEEYRKGLFLRT
ncbi:helix-turn-helix domain-containing protein [bacterium]|nr:helix-turn-helix domain-containing protein [candidate division CSSED10-310 bacterium]